MLFLPEPEVRKQTSFLVIHPFAEEKKSAHRTLVELSRELYRHGYPVLMFDLRGCGDSEWDFGTVRLDEWLADIHAAVGLLKSYTACDRPDMLALRFGAFLAQCYDRKYPGDTAEHIWIEPIMHPVDYLRKSLRQKLMKELCTDGTVTSSRDGLLHSLQDQKSIDFDGYEIGSGLYQDFLSPEYRVFDTPATENGKRGLLVSVSLNGKMSRSVQEAGTLFPEMETLCLQMELFWNKVDDADNDILIDGILNYVMDCHVDDTSRKDEDEIASLRSQRRCRQGGLGDNNEFENLKTVYERASF
jgi:pimeloyl-ACP methyl ester carboxylesterase